MSNYERIQKTMPGHTLRPRFNNQYREHGKTKGGWKGGKEREVMGGTL